MLTEKKTIDSVERKLLPGQAYARMVAELSDAIAHGALQVGDRLPTEASLRDTYGISIKSVRKGLDDLAKKGIVEKRHAKGTFVAQKPILHTPPVQRNTIGLFYDLQHAGYHPYYTEMRNGVTLGLMQRGWTLQQYAPPTPRGNAPTYYQGFNPDEVQRLFAGPSAFVAAVMTTGTAMSMKDWLNDRGIPFVALDPWATPPDLPFVRYDWNEEILQAIRLAIRPRHKQLFVVSSTDETRLHTLVSHAASLEETSMPIVTGCKVLLGNGGITDMARTIHERVIAHFQKYPNTDAVVAGSDAEAQATLDALASLGRQVSQDIRMVAVINKESRLLTASQIPLIVADGHALGMRAAELLHQRILDPHHSPRQIVLRASIQLPCV